MRKTEKVASLEHILLLIWGRDEYVVIGRENYHKHGQQHSLRGNTIKRKGDRRGDGTWASVDLHNDTTLERERELEIGIYNRFRCWGLERIR